jgi:hypothetical protein
VRDLLNEAFLIGEFEGEHDGTSLPLGKDDGATAGI